MAGGNAVPPYLAKQIGNVVMDLLARLVPLISTL